MRSAPTLGADRTCAVGIFSVDLALVARRHHFQSVVSSPITTCVDLNFQQCSITFHHNGVERVKPSVFFGSERLVQRSGDTCSVGAFTAFALTYKYFCDGNQRSGGCLAILTTLRKFLDSRPSSLLVDLSPPSATHVWCFLECSTNLHVVAVAQHT